MTVSLFSVRSPLWRVLSKGISRSLRRFKLHNERHFPWTVADRRRRPEVLIEVNNMYSTHIAYSYLANVLAERHGARIVGYVAQANRSRKEAFKAWTKRTIGYAPYGAYRSFGTGQVVTPVLTRAQKARAGRLFAQIYDGIASKTDIEAMRVSGIWIGDLVYDAYLREYARPTIIKASVEFVTSLRHSLELFVFWQDYLDAHDVRAINVSHTVYGNAIPLRIAVARGIPVYQVNLTHCYRLDAEHLFAYGDFTTFRERFAALPEAVRDAGLAEAQRRIERRFRGEVGVDMAYSTKSAFRAPFHPRLLSESPRKKILIAAHCFFDSPHSYGNNLFPDFYEWLDFLGQMSERTDYDWHIKTHPDFLPGSKEIAEAFVSKYQKLTMLPSDASHHQLIAEGIDVVLTCYGSVGFEYAALGVPVINASMNNPHIAFDFNVHARDVEHYRQLLLQLDELPLVIDRQEVLAYYFMAFIHHSPNLFFSDYDGTIHCLGGYAKQFTPAIYDVWLDQWTLEQHEALLAALVTFVESEDYRMDERHLPPPAAADVFPIPA